MPAILRLPITNVYANGDFTVSVSIGSEAIKLQLILDTGSSTLALHSSRYQPQLDTHLQPTTLVQEVIYGIGGWAGPVTQTSMQLHGDVSLTLPQNFVALATRGEPPLAKADGILGLAYKRLNQATDISEFLAHQQPALSASLPWPFRHCGVDSLKQIAAILQDYPKHNLPPWFSNIEQHGVVANIFAFYCRRSSIHRTAQQTHTSQDPLNQGWFILGGGVEQHDLYDGDFQNIRVWHDVYYNVQLTAIQVGDLAPIPCPPGNGVDSANGFFDTGSSVILLPDTTYQSLLQHLVQFNPLLQTVLQQLPAFTGVEQGLDATLINLVDWPVLYFYFASGNGDTVKLACPPHDYWQMNAPEFGLSSFKIIAQLPHFANQSIIGLPLLCNYFTVFDRAAHQTGVIRCAVARR